MIQVSQRLLKNIDSKFIHSLIQMLPILLVPFVMLDVGAHIFDPKTANYAWIDNLTLKSDLFLYTKMKDMLYLGLFMFVNLLAYNSVWWKGFQWFFSYEKIWFFILLFIFGYGLSSFYSEYQYFTFHGVFEQFEPIGVWFSYVLTVIYGYCFINSIQRLKLALISIFSALSVISIIGSFQYFGYDFLQTNLAKFFYLSDIPKQFWDSVEFKEGQSYITLYNPNYVGVLIALVAPIIFSMLILSLRKKSVKAVLFFILLMVGAILSLAGAKSSAGMVVGMLGLMCILLLQLKRVSRKMTVSLASSLAFAIALLVYSIGDSLVEKIVRSSPHYSLEGIETHKDRVNVLFDGNEFSFRYNPQAKTMREALVVFSDNILLETAVVSATAEKAEELKTLVIIDERFFGIKLRLVKIKEALHIELNIDDQLYYFTNQNKSSRYVYRNRFGNYDTMSYVSKVESFDQYHAAMNSRGYIWSRTLPLMADKTILGSGADTFVFVFPNDDYVGLKQKMFNQLVTKPHNMYLGIAVQAGLLALIMYLLFFVAYLTRAFKAVKQSTDKGSVVYHIHIGLLVGLMSFMIVSITNDSTVCTTPLFMLMLGLGLATSRILSKD